LICQKLVIVHLFVELRSGTHELLEKASGGKQSRRRLTA
jgi:hypothetical protein